MIIWARLCGLVLRVALDINQLNTGASYLNMSLAFIVANCVQHKVFETLT
jgi:hypothetical protein